MGNGCTRTFAVDDGSDEEYKEIHKKDTISRMRHSLSVSDNCDGLDASVRFVTRKTKIAPKQHNGDSNLTNNLRMNEYDNNDSSDGSDEAIRGNPYATKCSTNNTNTSKTCMLGTDCLMKDLVLGRKLGSGSYGTVYVANFIGMNGYLRDKPIAAKVLKVPKEGDAERERMLIDFENEVNSLTRVQHPRILLFLGCVAQHPNEFVIMTEVLAGNVCQVLKKTKETGKVISWDIATQIMLDVAEGMTFLHRYFLFFFVWVFISTSSIL